MTETGTDGPRGFNDSVIADYRASDGRMTGQFSGAPLLLLTTTGAKSGRPHTTPLAYTRDGDRLLVYASFAGSPKHPAWYHNLVAHPTATVELGSETFEVEAEVTTGEERDRLFAEHADRVPQFADYQRRTSRPIPVVALNRR